jgi:hypothetical protein
VGRCPAVAFETLVARLDLSFQNPTVPESVAGIVPAESEKRVLASAESNHNIQLATLLGSKSEMLFDNPMISGIVGDLE